MFEEGLATAVEANDGVRFERARFERARFERASFERAWFECVRQSVTEVSRNRHV